MPQCKPEAKEASSVRRSVNGGQGLGLQMTQGLVPEPWTVAPPGNRDALSGHRVCRVQGSAPWVSCQAQPCHHLWSGLADLTRDLNFKLDPSVLLPQWAHKSYEADDWFGSTRSSRHRDNHLDVGNKRSRAAWTPSVWLPVEQFPQLLELPQLWAPRGRQCHLLSLASKSLSFYFSVVFSRKGVFVLSSSHTELP